MGKWARRLSLKQVMLFFCCVGTVDGYIGSLALYQLQGTKILVMGDCHCYGKSDLEHRVQLHDFFEVIKNKSAEVAVLLEGNYSTTSKLSNILNCELLLPATWLYGYDNNGSNLVFHFADPRIESHKLYKNFNSNFFLSDLCGQSDKLLEEYRTSIREFTLIKSMIVQLDCKGMLELVNLRLDKALKTLEATIALGPQVLSNEQLIELQEIIIQSYLDIADNSFCLKLYQLIKLAQTIIVLVGEDHTVRINHMLQLLGYTVTQLTTKYDVNSQLPVPIALSEIDSYFSDFLG